MPTITPYSGAKGRVLQTDNATVVVFDLEPKMIIETHKHEVEQFGVVVKGSLAMIIAGEQRILTPGDTYRIPPGSAHALR
ncbi:MAG: cupin domain-containing protein, partial [Chloroflexi bacterium]